jgi:microcin C transport system permease protein
LFIVMIVSSIISPNLFLLVVIISLFSWMGTTIYIRTAAMKEKARDYVASARLLGASTPGASSSNTSCPTASPSW